jgi:hypothetical protein
VRVGNLGYYAARGDAARVTADPARDRSSRVISCGTRRAGGGARASNITVTNSPPLVGAGTSGSVNVRASAAQFVVQGATSTVKIGP